MDKWRERYQKQNSINTFRKIKKECEKNTKSVKSEKMKQETAAQEWIEITDTDHWTKGEKLMMNEKKKRENGRAKMK